MESQTLLSVKDGLEFLAARRPELGSIVRQLPDNCELDAIWLRKYSKVQAAKDPHNIVLRTLMCERRLKPWSEGVTADPAFREARAVEYLAYSPRSYLPNFSFEKSVHESVVPRPIKQMVPEASKRPHMIALLLADRVMRRRDTPAATLAAARAIYERHLYSVEDFVALLEGRRALQQSAAEALFLSGIQEVAGHNILSLVAAVTRALLPFGKAQDKIPAAAVEYLGCRYRSLPLLDVLGDVLDLRGRELIGVLPGRYEAVFQDVLAARNGQRASQAIWDQHFDGYALMGLPESDLFQARREARKVVLKSYTSVRFNMERWLRRQYTAIARDQLGSAYDSLDVTGLKRVVNGHIKAIHPGLLIGLRRLVEELGMDHPIHYRDLANVLLHAWHQDRQDRPQWEYLPAVAQYALGRSDPGDFIATTGVGSRGPRPKRMDKAWAARPEIRVLSDALRRAR